MGKWWEIFPFWLNCPFNEAWALGPNSLYLQLNSFHAPQKTESLFWNNMRVSIIFILGGWTVPPTPHHFCNVLKKSLSREFPSLTCLAIAIPAHLQQIPYCCSHFPLAADSDCKCTHGYSRASADVSAAFLCFVCICLHPCANEIIRGLIKHTELEPQLWQWQGHPDPMEDMAWETTKTLIKKDGQRLGEREREKFVFHCCSRSLSFPLAEEQVSPALRLDGCLILDWHCGHHMRINAWQSLPQ